MDLSIPAEVTELLGSIDEFIDRELAPIEAANPEFFDHRREFARTDLERGGIPTERWRELLGRARRLAIDAGFYQYPFPAELGGSDGSNLAMAIIREHLAHRGPGLHAELSHEASVVANEPLVLVLHEYGTPEQRQRYLEPLVDGRMAIAFALTEPGHGSDATYLETTARPADGGGWVLHGAKRFITGIDVAEAALVFARTSGPDGKAQGITAFLVPVDTPGFDVPYYHWCLNMPTDHGEVTLDDVRVGYDAVLGEVDRGLDCAQLFVHENRIRQAASSLGAAQFCIDRSIAYAQRARHLRQAAGRLPGGPVAAGGASDRGRTGAQHAVQDRLGDGPAGRGINQRQAERLGQGVDGQLPGQPAGLRRRRPRHPGPRRPRLHPPPAV